MKETDDIHEWDHEFYLHTVRARDDLLLNDAMRVFEMWEGQKPSRVERYTRRKNGKPEKIHGPHAKVDHETKAAVMGALSPKDLEAVGSKNPDVYIKSKGDEDDDDLIVIVKPSTQARNEGRGRKHITNVHARNVLGENYRDKLNVLKLTTTDEPDLFVLTIIIMENGNIYRFVQHQIEDSILRD